MRALEPVKREPPRPTKLRVCTTVLALVLLSLWSVRVAHAAPPEGPPAAAPPSDDEVPPEIVEPPPDAAAPPTEEQTEPPPGEPPPSEPPPGEPAPEEVVEPTPDHTTCEIHNRGDPL